MSEQTKPNPGDTRTVEQDGEKVTYVWQLSPWLTIREYYSHDGPGWDFRGQLLDNAESLRLYGRTFSLAEVYGRKNDLPELPHYRWEEVI